MEKESKDNLTDWEDGAFKSAVKKILASVKINKDYDIPYAAGYSKDGKTVYIDKDIPQKIPINGKLYDIHRTFAIHECEEKRWLLTGLLSYVEAHQMALRIEKAVVEMDKVSWSAYDKATDKYIKESINQTMQKIPPDLDLTPYKEEHETLILKNMSKLKGGK